MTDVDLVALALVLLVIVWHWRARSVTPPWDDEGSDDERYAARLRHPSHVRIIDTRPYDQDAEP